MRAESTTTAAGHDKGQSSTEAADTAQPSEERRAAIEAAPGGAQPRHREPVGSHPPAAPQTQHIAALSDLSASTLSMPTSRTADKPSQGQPGPSRPALPVAQKWQWRGFEEESRRVKRKATEPARATLPRPEPAFGSQEACIQIGNPRPGESPWEWAQRAPRKSWQLS